MELGNTNLWQQEGGYWGVSEAVAGLQEQAGGRESVRLKGRVHEEGGTAKEAGGQQGVDSRG